VTLIPTPELAKAITAVVMETIERQGTISSVALDEAVLRELLFRNATAGMSKAGADDEITACSAHLIRLLFSKLTFGTLPQEVVLAIGALHDRLLQKGLL
jgi:hypothetical protein